MKPKYFAAAFLAINALWAVPATAADLVEVCTSVSDETTTITAGPAKVTINIPYAFMLSDVYAYLRIASSAGPVVVDINEDVDAEGDAAPASILSVPITIDPHERRSVTAEAAPVISDPAIAAHAEISIDIDAPGVAATGLKVCLVGNQT
jgi:hypothetical protein